MSLRHVLYTILLTDSDIVSVYSDRIIDSGELGHTDGQTPVFPYLCTVWGQENPTMSPTGLDEQVELWSYDDPRDFTRTKKGLAAIRSFLDRQGPWSTVVDGKRYWLTEARWLGTSKDFQDDSLRASAKYATYRLVGNVQ